MASIDTVLIFLCFFFFKFGHGMGPAWLRFLLSFPTNHDPGARYFLRKDTYSPTRIHGRAWSCSMLLMWSLAYKQIVFLYIYIYGVRIIGGFRKNLISIL